MNTETINDNTAPQSTGSRLREAREQLGLTQQSVAERLCLKLAMIHNIEEDKPCDVSPAFLRGYVRSYARLVHLAEDDLLFAPDEQTSGASTVLSPVPGFNFNKGRKKQDSWLMLFTWLIVFIVTGLTGLWWWQNHKAVHTALTTPVQQDQDSVADAEISRSARIPNVDEQKAPVPAPPASVAPVNIDHQMVNDQSNISAKAEAAPKPDVPPATASNVSGVQKEVITNTPPTPMAKNTTNNTEVPALKPLPSATETAANTAADSAILVLDFNNRCWLEVSDATGKKLFSGMHSNGGKLMFSGRAPYQLSIGAPAAVQVKFQGEVVDLSSFIRNNRVAHLTLGAH